MYAKFISIFAVESFVSFSFTGDYLNLEMFNIFYLLGVYYRSESNLHFPHPAFGRRGMPVV
jgi:hypothetical protein